MGYPTNPGRGKGGGVSDLDLKACDSTKRQGTADGTNFLQNGYILHTPTFRGINQVGFVPLRLVRL